LYLTSNRLSSLGSIVKSSSHLNILDIYGNVFKEVPKEILNLKEITRLDLGNNDIIELPPKLGLLSTIKFLRFEGNRIKGIKVNKTSEVLKLLKNRIPTDELQEFQGIYLILFYFILFYFILFYFILFYFILFYFILFLSYNSNLIKKYIIKSLKKQQY